MTKEELQKEIENIKNMLSLSNNQKEKDFWCIILKETQEELSKE